MRSVRSVPSSTPPPPPRYERGLGLALSVVLALLHLFKNFTDISHRDVWLDEASTYLVAAYPLPRVLTLPIEFHSQPPLYYLVLHFLEALGTGPAFLRGFSWLCVLATALFLLYGPLRVGLLGRALAALALITSGFTHYLAQEMRPYAFSLFFTLAASVCFVRLLASPTNRRWAVAYGVCAVLMSYATAFTLGAFLAHGLLLAATLAIAAYRRRSTFGVSFRQFAAEYLGPVLAVALVGLLYLPYVVWVSPHASEGHPALSASLGAAASLYSPLRHARQLFAFSSPVAYLLGALTLLCVFGPRPQAWLWPAMFLIQVVFVEFFCAGRIAVTTRYFTHAFAPLLVCLALGVDVLLARLARLALQPRFRWCRLACGPCALIALLVFTSVLAARKIPSFVRYATSPLPNSNWRDLAAALEGLAGKKAIFFRTGFLGQTLGYAARDARDLVFLTDGEPPPPGHACGAIGRSLSPQYVRAAIAAQAERVDCFLYSQDLRQQGRDLVYEQAFLSEMVRLGWPESFRKDSGDVPDRFHDHYEVRGHCRPSR